MQKAPRHGTILVMKWVKVDTSDKKAMEEFWRFTEPYFEEIVTDAKDLEYFLGDEYRGAIEEISLRKVDPVTLLVALGGRNLAAACIYQAEGAEKIFLMEFYLEKSLRGFGTGRRLYLDLEKALAARGIKQISLTPALEGSRIFWQKMGYAPCGETADNGKEIHIKKPEGFN